MRRFLYYFPGRPGINAAALSLLGVLDRFEQSRGELGEYQISPCDLGPDGQSGCIAALGSVGMVFAPDRQRWTEGKGYWVGVEEPWPLPEHLVREIIIWGDDVRMADARLWRVPVLHRWDESACKHVPNLPTFLRNLPGGACEVAVRPEYLAADTLAREIWAGFQASKVLPAPEAFAKAVAVLNVNYRIGSEEANLLGLLDADSILSVLGMAVDLPKIAAQKHSMELNGLEWSEPIVQGEE